MRKSRSISRAVLYQSLQQSPFITIPLPHPIPHLFFLTCRREQIGLGRGCEGERLESPITVQRIDIFHSLMAVKARSPYLARPFAGVIPDKKDIITFAVIFADRLETRLSSQKSAAVQLEFERSFAQLHALGDVCRHGLAVIVDQSHLPHQYHVDSGREWRGRGARREFP